MVCSRLWDGEIEIATIPDYCAYLRVMSWVDVFDVSDTAAVRARYEEERARGDMRYQICGDHRKREFQVLISRIGLGSRAGREWTKGRAVCYLVDGAPYRTKMIIIDALAKSRSLTTG